MLTGTRIEEHGKHSKARMIDEETTRGWILGRKETGIDMPHVGLSGYYHYNVCFTVLEQETGAQDSTATSSSSRRHAILGFIRHT